MPPSPPVPHKRARGAYAKFICFACRERRIKCQLPENVTIIPSSEPQGAETSCRRCQQQGLDCIVRKTTLGRPNQKRHRSTTPPGTVPDASTSSRSPSPAVEDFILLNLQTEKQPPPSAMTFSSTAYTSTSVVPPTSAKAMEAVGKTFESTSTLMARDRRFGRLNIGLHEVTPPPIHSIIGEKTAVMLDKYLIWQRLFLPHLPSLPKLLKDLRESDPQSGQRVSGTLLAALLASIALDVPTDASELASERHLQPALHATIFNFGQKVLFGLTRHDWTLMSLELVAACRPLALMSTQQAAAQCLNGRLYPALIKSLAQRLDIDSAPTRLRACIESGSDGDVSVLIYNTLRWAGCLMHGVYEDLGVERSGPDLRLSLLNALIEALRLVAEAIEQGRAPTDALLPYYIQRTHADQLLVVTALAKDWKDLPKLAAHIHQHTETQLSRKAEFERHLLQAVSTINDRDRTLALSQLFDIEQGVCHSDCLGLALFLAIMSTSILTCSANGTTFDPVRQLNKYFTECIDAEVSGKAANGLQSGVSGFLDLFGDPHIDSLERRLTDFINAATDLRLQDISYTGPPFATAEAVMMACKMIVENNAVRIKIDGKLHERADMQLILFQEAARRLEAMEHNGDGQDAVERGSVFAASGKLIRSLHRILWQWKRNYVVAKPQDAQQPQQTEVSQQSLDNIFAPTHAPSLGTDDFFADGFFTDWQNWPQAQWDPTELSNMFSYDFDASNI